MDKQQKQTIFDPAKVIAIGIASPAATLLTSRFGVAGTLLGLALSAVIITVITDVLKVYLVRVSGSVVKVPGGLRTRLFRREGYARRRTILRGSFIAALFSFLVGLSIVTGFELSVGRSLSCWIWNHCLTEPSTSTGDGRSSETSTLPSIFGGGQNTSSNAPTVGPASFQQNPASPAPPESPSVTSSAPSASSSEAPGSERPDSEASDQGQYQPSLREEYQQQSPPDYSEEDQQQSPPSTMEGDQSSDNNSSSGSPNLRPDSGQKPRGYEVLQVPWTT